MPPVHIVFEGLISHVIRKIGQITVLDILLPRVEEPVTSLRDPAVILEPHLPCLRFDNAYVEAGAVVGLPSDSVLIQRDGKSERLIFLKKEVIGFHTGQPATGVTPYTFGTAPGPEHPVPDEGTDNELDHRWIAPMEKVCATCRDVDPDCVGTNTKRLVRVRTQFREGRLVTRELSRDEDGTISQYEFPDMDGEVWLQALAEISALETATDGFLQISGINDDGQNLIIKPVSANLIEVTLLNTEAEHFLMDPVVVSGDPEDFELFFELLDRRLPRRREDRRIPTRTESAGDRICPMSRFG